MNAEQMTDRKRVAGQSTHPMMIGVFIGVLLGLCLALGVALYINRAPKPFVNRDVDTAKNDAPAKTAPKFEPVKPDKAAAAQSPAAQTGKPPEGTTRLDFYKILPGEEPVTGKDIGPSTT